MNYRVYLLFLVAVVGASQWVASMQTAPPSAAQADALMPERAFAERTVERMSRLEAAGGVEAMRPAGAAEVLPCDSLSFVGGGPLCHTAAPELHIERDLAGALRVTAVRRTPRGAHVVARARVRGLDRDDLIIEAMP